MARKKYFVRGWFEQDILPRPWQRLAYFGGLAAILLAVVISQFFLGG